MKRIGLIGLLSISLVSCHQEAITEPWEVAMSRSITNNENVLVVGKKGNNEQLRGILIPSNDEGAAARWQGSTPTWPGADLLDMYIISPAPADGKLPQSIHVGDGTAWMVDYLPSAHKPNRFSLEHLLAKLQVHIRIDNDTERMQPLDVKMTLHTEAEIDFPCKGLKNLSGKSNDNVYLGEFMKDASSNWVSAEVLILPQILVHGEVCLRFRANGGEEYRFTPDTDLRFLAGKVNHLYLGIAFEQLELILIGNGTSITDWSYGDFQSGEALEN